jgi:hypothetical protein
VVRLLVVALAACAASASGPPRAAPPPPAAAPPPVVDEQARHDQLAAAHREIEERQQEALAETCDEPKGHPPHERCLPSCYPTEPVDPRSTKRLAGSAEVTHLVCEAAGGTGDGPFSFADEIDGTKLPAHAAHVRTPPHKKGTWQATVEAALDPMRGDRMVVVGTWRERSHPITKERLRCVTVAQFTVLRHPLDGCGGDGGLACEATGNAAARAINVVHYRVVEARALEAARKTDDCQKAALEAVAVSRGLPRWRQYSKLNVRTWVDHPGYRTRFDGTLGEDALFAEVARLGGEAQQAYAACGGAPNAPTTAEQEQSFHSCW